MFKIFSVKIYDMEKYTKLDMFIKLEIEIFKTFPR